jgi:hypothetical protein
LIDADLAPLPFSIRTVAAFLRISPMSETGRKRMLFRTVRRIQRMQHVFSLDFSTAATAARRRLRSALAGWRRAPASAVNGERDASGEELIQQRQYKRAREEAVDTAYLWAKVHYRAVPYEGRTALLLTDDWAQRYRKNRWRPEQFFKNLEIRAIPGTHHICVTDFVGELASEIKAVLEKLPDQK